MLKPIWKRNIRSHCVNMEALKKNNTRVNQSGQLVGLSANQRISLPCTVSGLQQMISNELGASDPEGLATFHWL